MTDNELLMQLKVLIESDSLSLIEVRQILLEYKNQGGKQKDAEDVGHLLRTLNLGKEDADDRIQEVLDIAIGWCSPHLRVW